ncbi:ureidoglycolate lyase [Pseudaestuariivita rosea]|uniref:ureidoglycolate lyase n=1 Tax=Pseudaestuariivita rosea TaxID=2763263 RepID=UPI001ABAC57E|nr:ureidoglycolate lyase [Pseudaestuariivita rosea]
MTTIRVQPLTAKDFAPYGDVLQADGDPDVMINQSLCGRYHDCAGLDFSGGRAGISIFNAEPRALPLPLEMMERHPLGSQAFIPMTQHPFLVIVAADDAGQPADIKAFLTVPGQGVNYHRGTWHGVLTPLHTPGLFAVVDRIGQGENLQEHWFETPVQIVE